MSKSFSILSILSAILLAVCPSLLSSQEIKIFDISDFDLRGNVKSCLVITDYGKEEYHFDAEGRLTKAVTRFNESNYETTYYKYQNGELIEKRVENYRDDAFDKATSIAHFYQIDTTANRKITEKIVSYTKRLLEQNVYRYGPDGNLIKITQTDTDGTDQTLVSYDTLDGKKITTHELNGRPLTSVHVWEKKTPQDVALRVKLTEKYFDGTLNTKTEEVYNSDEKLVSSAESLYDESTEKWIPQVEISYTYDDKGMLSSAEMKRGNAVSSKEYIYQFDGTEHSNWVKEIVTPDNTYKTRRIKYYEVAAVEEQQENN